MNMIHILRTFSRGFHSGKAMMKGVQRTPEINISSELVHHLERTSLVDFESAEALERLSEAINFADKLFEVNTDGVEPLVSVLENEALYLREDKAEATERRDILQNASVTEEDYFVAPPGNIPLEASSSRDFIQKAETETQSS